ncbi:MULTISPECIES: hypothetical protein [Curtobacterium]|jgi:hypothetical protein|uniref:Uncharacterized protein n=2 Tax=Curtobacterium TaxID=2034 RepID=A0A5P8YVD1_9MICO|nr:hypothetical protein [Curtobacterium flaccumfaciens]MBO9041484.1 hypothetical protein [Curtobacterium flaccumfaciens pv. flaccumfaciens]MBO9044970.1 hypothetical protein [Curtobacterium flaccumfaciens pv. flaccumfaciens]MBO9048887.1 hypothetical protein [Curtobacterium flaccumfaciens pv. flaccumfaciens]MBO9057738.1 hypothetical protein [Curtobacterium flaccumfaciens pv. flaccumfaciens]MBT1543177.1 hypothetical protein [Curtobacterium flaccumfaciens pv. flaccumfaciens]
MATVTQTIKIQQQFKTPDALRSALEEACDVIADAFPAGGARFAQVTSGNLTSKSEDMRDAWSALDGAATAGRIDYFVMPGIDDFRAILRFPGRPTALDVQGEVKGIDHKQVRELADRITEVLTRHAA